MKCTRCHRKAIVQLRQHNANFCRDCFLLFFERQVGRAVRRERMFAPGEEILVAVSGGKDSLALWEVLLRLGYRATGLHLELGIGDYSRASLAKCERYARQRDLRLITVSLAAAGAPIPALAAVTRRPACAACGTAKRHYFDTIARQHGFKVMATGHNLDDEAARLLGNVLRWQAGRLAKQSPVLEPTAPGFVRKVKPLFRTPEYETAVYAFVRQIDYLIDECPNSAGATQLVYKHALNRIEAASPGTKLAFVQEFLRTGRAGFAAARADFEAPGACVYCGLPAYDERCSFCALLLSAGRQREHRSAAPYA